MDSPEVTILDLRAACRDAESSSEAFGKLLETFPIDSAPSPTVVKFVVATLALMTEGYPSFDFELHMPQHEVSAHFRLVYSPDCVEKQLMPMFTVLEETGPEIGLSSTLISCLHTRGDKPHLRVLISLDSLIVGGRSLWDSADASTQASS